MKISVLALTAAALTMQAASGNFCCSWDYTNCGQSQWCNQAQGNCEDACSGVWLDPSTNFETGDDCCSWDGTNCGSDNYCNALQSNCEGNCHGSWISSSSGGGGGSPTTAPPTTPAPTNPPTTPSPTNPPPAPTTPSPTNAPAPTADDDMTLGELTWWTGSEPGPLSGSSCSYAAPDAISQNDSWLAPYVHPKMYCAVSEDLFANGVGCGKCYRLVYDPSMGGTDPASAGSADIQVVNSGAGGSKHFDCFEDAFHALTGISTGIFPVNYVPIPCTYSPVTAVVLDGYNSWYVKTLIAGGTTGVVAVDITVGSQTVAMSKVVGATWSAGLSGTENVNVKYTITFADGSMTTLDNCHAGTWPVATGSYCS